MQSNLVVQFVNKTKIAIDSNILIKAMNYLVVYEIFVTKLTKVSKRLYRVLAITI